MRKAIHISKATEAIRVEEMQSRSWGSWSPRSYSCAYQEASVGPMTGLGSWNLKHCKRLLGFWWSKGTLAKWYWNRIKRGTYAWWAIVRYLSDKEKASVERKAIHIMETTKVIGVWRKRKVGVGGHGPFETTHTIYLEGPVGSTDDLESWMFELWSTVSDYSSSSNQVDVSEGRWW